MKCKYALLDRLIPLTGCQINVFISLVRRSDERFALARGIYYKDIVKETGCCNQSFYNSLKALEEHGVIRVSRNSDLDYDVCICGNAYPTQDYSKETYVNFNDDVFYMKAFQNLKGHEKYLFLYFYQYTFRKGEGQTMKRNKKEFYKEMTGKLGVTEEVLRKYLHQLKLFFSIGILNGNLLITRKAVSRKKSKKDKTEEQWMLEQYLTSECRRLHISYEEKDIRGLMELLKSRRNHFRQNGTWVALGKMLSAIADSIRGYRPKERQLSGGYVNKLFCLSILKSDHEEQPDVQALYNSKNLSLCF